MRCAEAAVQIATRSFSGDFAGRRVPPRLHHRRRPHIPFPVFSPANVEGPPGHGKPHGAAARSLLDTLMLIHSSKVAEWSPGGDRGSGANCISPVELR
ncbi:hypothetical protein ANCCAN_07549 [Ancylostoma caninum]|uniref:Uncharacterized protein n=1 Tax=Ancylostoma caninum TaxID=29170 RepID=A0A368GPR7_ANCCA|nr:hypothetical protein ANCCAN_07549 [Ancylostoma caninum]